MHSTEEVSVLLWADPVVSVKYEPNSFQSWVKNHSEIEMNQSAFGLAGEVEDYINLRLSWEWLLFFEQSPYLHEIYTRLE